MFVDVQQFKTWLAVDCCQVPLPAAFARMQLTGLAAIAFSCKSGAYNYLSLHTTRNDKLLVTNLRIKTGDFSDVRQHPPSNL